MWFLLHSKTYPFGLLLLVSYAHYTKSSHIDTNALQMGGLPSTELKETHWYPDQVWNATNDELSYGIIILNRPIEVHASVLTNLWRKAKIRCTVDQGTDRWLLFLNQHNLDPALYWPDLVTGDFDSVSSNSMGRFLALGSDIVPTPDQSYTDFQKAVMEITKREKIDYLISIVEFNGRLDHCMSNINTLYKSSLPIYLLSAKYMSWVLRANAGLHRIHLNPGFTSGKKTLGLIPVGSPVQQVYSTGLKWNLNNHTLAFGGMVSSSNTYENETTPEVSVKMSQGDLLWIMQLPSHPRTESVTSNPRTESVTSNPDETSNSSVTPHHHLIGRL
ncbi:thiamin pyrophosphokinase 1 [Diaphorina citri]|uniref:Thiamin pyrophosphokinase 1 n=1 Tax=Diaphorina citri TaxID=121845 RepID=A0A1S4EII1_DIACI|nr:thiamin pyrophosphokinase 1 [Diaphorina citri]XP_017301939.1 thiamin pyrophosphokinase 1 [Diaphorina citri]